MGWGASPLFYTIEVSSCFQFSTVLEDGSRNFSCDLLMELGGRGAEEKAREVSACWGFFFLELLSMCSSPYTENRNLGLMLKSQLEGVGMENNCYLDIERIITR